MKLRILLDASELALYTFMYAPGESGINLYSYPYAVTAPLTVICFKYKFYDV